MKEDEATGRDGTSNVPLTDDAKGDEDVTGELPKKLSLKIPVLPKFSKSAVILCRSEESAIADPLLRECTVIGELICKGAPFLLLLLLL